MDYVLLNLSPKRSFSILEFESLKQRINKLLEIEFVDNESIFWDETGELMFSPPLNKKDKTYWLNVLNSQIRETNWEFIKGKV